MVKKKKAVKSIKKKKLYTLNVKLLVASVFAAVVVLLLFFAIPFPSKSTEIVKEEVPYEETQSYVEEEPYIEYEDYFVIVEEQGCDAEEGCKCDSTIFNMATGKYDICVKCTCTRQKEITKYRDVTKTRTITLYDYELKEVTSVNYATVFQRLIS